MLYLAIDQHIKQLTVNMRDERGDILLKRQVSTQWKRVREFFSEVQKQAEAGGGFVAILEVCGFNDWLLKILKEYGCRETVLIQAEKPSKKKTDRRDANALGEILWVNRERLLAGKRVQGVRRVHVRSELTGENRQITAVRKRLGQSRTRIINRIRHIVHKHNLQQDCPTKGIDTQAAAEWLRNLSLPAVDRLELDQLLKERELYDEQIEAVEIKILERYASDRIANLSDLDSRCRGLFQRGLGVADRACRAFSLARQPGELLGADALLPELRGGDRPPGLDQQARQHDGPLHPGAVGAARLAEGSRHAGVVSAHQASAGREDRPCGGNAPLGRHHRADGQRQPAIRRGRSTSQRRRTASKETNQAQRTRGEGGGRSAPEARKETEDEERRGNASTCLTTPVDFGRDGKMSKGIRKTAPGRKACQGLCVLGAS